MSSAQTRLTALVGGRVQGVGFRAWAREKIRALGLEGSARNLPDGQVEVVAQGSREACERLLAALRGSGPPGKVSAVTPTWTDVSR